MAFVLASAFLLLSFCGHWARYGIGKRRLRSWWTIYKSVSWRLSELFPPLLPPLAPSHLARWREIGEAIEQNAELKAYLVTLEEYRDLEMFTSYISPGLQPYFKFRAPETP
ncbi:hypothetical protein MUP07_10975 [Candidatus Bathyarchaeota archaeon]|nr:hypothetical protein [Candidatus Bathyarchaeota archaeon]